MTHDPTRCRHCLHQLALDFASQAPFCPQCRRANRRAVAARLRLGLLAAEATLATLPETAVAAEDAEP